MFSPASFNGIPFYIDTAEREAGHRVATTTVPNGGHINESFGPAPRKWTINAYCPGASAYATADALSAAVEAAHVGVLVLPAESPALVRLTKVARTFERDKLGYAAVSIEAVAEPLASLAGPSADVLALAAYAIAARVPAVLGAAFAAALTLAGQPRPVSDAATLAAADALADAVALRQAARLAPAAEAVVAPAFDAALAALPDLPAAPAAFAEALALAGVALADAAAPVPLVHWLKDAAPLPVAAVPVTAAHTAAGIASNTDATVALTAACRALTLAEGLIGADFASRAAVREVQAIAAAVFFDAAGRMGAAFAEAAALLRDLEGALADVLAARTASLAETITVSVPARLPSLWWSWRLYGTSARADEVMIAARAFNPAFMPLTFETRAA